MVIHKVKFAGLININWHMFFLVSTKMEGSSEFPLFLPFATRKICIGAASIFSETGETGKPTVLLIAHMQGGCIVALLHLNCDFKIKSILAITY